MPWRNTALSLVTLLAACTFVTKKDRDDKFACLDEDGDLAVKEAGCATIGAAEADCDDANGDRTPTKPEIAYDGIDNNCDLEELFDVDEDGFPGIAQADWRQNDDFVTWPDTLQADVDCDDEDDAIYPASEAEVPYDGVDSDCDEADDYDFDNDGYVLRSDLLPEGSPTYIGPLPGGDCDDHRAEINPGVSSLSDTAYDGVDTNCDENNDFDADGDGWMPAGSELAFQQFIERFGYSFPDQFGDCNDLDDTIYVGADDWSYDGIDSNCDEADDYDYDQDGFALREDLLPEGSAPYSGALEQTDCADEDAEVFPGALERIGDAIDSDCDGGARTATFGFSLFEWTAPRHPSVGATNFHYLLTTAADNFVSGTPRNNVGVTVLFPKDARGGSEPTTTSLWETAVQLPFGEQLDVIYGSDRYYVGASHQRPVANRDRNDLRIYRFVWAADLDRYARAYQSSIGIDDDPYQDIDIELDAEGKVLVGACGSTSAHFVRAYTAGSDVWSLDESLPGSTVDVVAPITGTSEIGSACTVETTSPNPTLRTFRAADAATFTTDWNTITYGGVDATWSAYKTHGVVHKGPLLIVAGTTPAGAAPSGVTVFSGGSLLGRYLLTDEVYSADAALLGGQIHLVAVVKDRGADGRDDLIMLSGPVANPTQTVVPYTRVGRQIEPVGAAIHADSERVFVAVSGATLSGGGTANVGWVFFRP